MYLSNVDIRRLLPEMGFTTDNADHPFQPESQVQLCSIDLRMSNVFWKQKRRLRVIDTHRSRVLEAHPRAYWKRVSLEPEQALTLAPQEFVLGRTHERFRIPPRYAGKSATRSSYARLGIETYCSCDFMNPGWEGYLPLEIVNNSRFKVKIYPFQPICQLMLVALSSEPEGTYGDEKLGSKYQHDDGGPSYWWRDRYLKRLLAGMRNQNIADVAVGHMSSMFDQLDDYALIRFERYIESMPTSTLNDPESAMAGFRRLERRSEMAATLFKWLFPALTTLALGNAVRSATTNPASVYGVFASAFAAIAFGIPAGYYLTREDRKFLGRTTPNQGHK